MTVLLGAATFEKSHVWLLDVLVKALAMARTH